MAGEALVRQPQWMKLEDKLDGLIQRAAGFYLLAAAVPVRGTLY